MSHDNRAIMHAILDAFDETEIGLPAPPTLGEDNLDAVKVMAELEAELGPKANSDYFRCSRERFLHIVRLAVQFIPRGSRLLDIGNAPGYLGQALYRAGYHVSGLNLSEAWNETYPDPSYLDRFKVKACDIEKGRLPFDTHTFDGIVFTEVLEHIVTKRPEELLPEFIRVIKPGGVVLFSTPNVCNLSNILALATGKNVFWPTPIFYGSTDRHNREWTPKEVWSLFEKAGFKTQLFYGMNDHANWRTGVADQIYALLSENQINHALLRNTVIGVFQSALFQADS